MREGLASLRRRKSKEQEAVASAPLGAKSPVLGLEAPPPQVAPLVLTRLAGAWMNAVTPLWARKTTDRAAT